MHTAHMRQARALTLALAFHQLLEGVAVGGSVVAAGFSRAKGERAGVSGVTRALWGFLWSLGWLSVLPPACPTHVHNFTHVHGEG